MADDHHIFRLGPGPSCSRNRTPKRIPIVPEYPHRTRLTSSRGDVHLAGRNIQGFHTSSASWRGSLSKHGHGGVGFVMDISASCRVANDLSGSALHWSSNACDVVFNGRSDEHTSELQSH